MAWTPEQERNFQELASLRSMERNLLVGCVERAVENLAFELRTPKGELARSLIDDAERLRKVLEPFDRSSSDYVGEGV